MSDLRGARPFAGTVLVRCRIDEGHHIAFDLSHCLASATAQLISFSLPSFSDESLDESLGKEVAELRLNRDLGLRKSTSLALQLIETYLLEFLAFPITGIHVVLCERVYPCRHTEMCKHAALDLPAFGKRWFHFCHYGARTYQF